MEGGPGMKRWREDQRGRDGGRTREKEMEGGPGRKRWREDQG